MNKSIISKLTFEDLNANTTIPSTYADNNKYSSLKWSRNGTPTVTNSNNIKVLSIKTSSEHIRISSSFTNSNNIINNDWEVEANIKILTMNSMNGYFGWTNTTSNYLAFYIKNSFNGGLTLKLGGNEVSFNYKFEANKDYNIIVSYIDYKFILIINGERIGFINGKEIVKSLATTSSILMMVGSADATTTNNLTSGELWNMNISLGAGVKNEDPSPLTKYGSNLLSRLNFDNLATVGSSNIFVAGLEAVNDSNIAWNYDSANINKYNVNTTITTNINNNFTLLIDMNNNKNIQDVKLIEYGNYKVIYNYIKIGDPDPTVRVDTNTTSALDFENDLTDKVSTTVWNKSGTADVTSVNKIFGDSSFETKALGDSLYTNSKIITGENTPFTIEFYILVKSDQAQMKDSTTSLPLLINEYLRPGYVTLSPQGLLLTSPYEATYPVPFVLRFVSWNSISNTQLNYYSEKIQQNTKSKITFTYDGSAHRFFIDDVLVGICGSRVGLYSSSEPYMFMKNNVKTGSVLTHSTTNCLIDNINIHDGIALKVREHDPYEEYLVVDLAFDGENNSTKIVDNGSGKNTYTWVLNELAKISTDQKFDGYSSLYLDGEGDFMYCKSLPGDAFNFDNDFTISVDFKTSITSKRQVLFDKYNGTLGQYQISINNNGSIYFTHKHPYVFHESITVNLNDGLEHNLRVVKNNNNIYLYIDNKFDSLFDASNVPFNQSIECIVAIGAQVNNRNSMYDFGGYIKNFKIYKGVAVIPESNLGKIQLDFDNNVLDKYNNSTWTNTGATFDQVNSIKGYSAKLISSSLIKTSNDNLNFEDKNFSVNFDYKSSNVSSGGRYIFTNNINNTVAGSMWFNSSSNTFFDYVDKPANTSGLALPISQNITNVYYNTNISRNSGVLTLKFNDVVVGMNNLTSQKFNFNGGDSFSLGRNTNFGGGTSFEGYVDNFNSYKEDLLKNNITIYKSPNVNMIVKSESVYTSYNGTPTGTSHGTMVFDDCPIISNFIAELEIFIKSDPNNHGILNFRTTDYSLNSMDNFGYSAYISGSNIKFGKGSNGINASWSEIATLVIPSKFQNDDYHTMKVVANGSNFKIFLDDELMHDVTDTTYNEATKLGWCTYLVNGWNGVSSRIKSLKISNLSGNELYYKDFKSKIENTIDRPAVHLPLETNSINTGFAALTINSVGSPTYTVVDNKKCIKFEQGKYLSINSNNIFNLGTSSDFYIEFDYYITEFKNQVIFCSASTVTTSNLFTITTSSDTQTISKKIYMYVNNRTLFYSDYEYSINAWNNIKVYRKNNTLTISLNGFETSTYINENVDFSFNGTFLGSNNYNQSSRLSDYMSNFKMFVGTSEPPETYNDKKVLNLDFKPTRKSYLFKDNNNKCIIHPVNITQRDYQDSKYCCSFNGDDQYLQLGKNDLLNFGNDDFVINIKFSVKSFTNVHQRLIADNEYSGGAFNYMMITGTNYSLTQYKHCIFFGIDDSALSYMFSTSKVELNTIYDIKIIREGNLFSMYVNGVFENSFSSSKVCNFNLNGNTNIGSSNPLNPNSSTVLNQRFNGTIYSLKVLRNTTDLSLLEEEVNIFEETFTLTNGNESDNKVILNSERKSNHNIRFVKDELNTSLTVDGEFVEVPLVENESTELKLFDEYNSNVKDVKLYDTAFTDDDTFLGSELIDTVFGEVEYFEDSSYDLEIIEGNYNLKGFIEGYTDREFYIYNTFLDYQIFRGTEYYDINCMNEYSLDDYEINDLVTGERYKVLGHEMIQGFISGTVNLKNCGVTSNNMEVFCYRSDNYRHIGTYSVDKDGKYVIPNLDVNSRYDIIFRDKTRKIKDQISNYRQPMEY